MHKRSITPQEGTHYKHESCKFPDDKTQTQRTHNNYATSIHHSLKVNQEGTKELCTSKLQCNVSSRAIKQKST